MVAHERRLGRGWETVVHERDGVIYRSPKPQSRTVLAFLRHLEVANFPASPRVVDPGIAPDGREMLSYIEGDSPRPGPWSDEALITIGTWLRELHETSRSFVAPADAMWRASFARELPGSDTIIGHGDLGPWNIVTRHGEPVAIIDWDFAGPIDSVWDLAQACWLNVQLHDDDVAAAKGLGGPEERARQLGLMVDAYGLAKHRRQGFVAKMAEYAVHAARQEAVDYKVSEASAQAVAEDGYPILWAITWRARSASWILRHQRTLSDALVKG